jgi:hypothetical protein
VQAASRQRKGKAAIHRLKSLRAFTSPPAETELAGLHAIATPAALNRFAWQLKTLSYITSACLKALPPATPAMLQTGLLQRAGILPPARETHNWLAKLIAPFAREPNSTLPTKPFASPHHQPVQAQARNVTGVQRRLESRRQAWALCRGGGSAHRPLRRQRVCRSSRSGKGHQCMEWSSQRISGIHWACIRPC